MTMKKHISLILVLLMLSSFLFIPIQSFAATPEKQAGRVSVSGGRLNVRAAATTKSAILGALTNGTTVTLHGKEGDFYKVEYGAGKLGYCHGDYITPLGGRPAKVAVGSSTLNVRTGAGTSYSRIGSLRDGSEVVVLLESGGWARVLYNGTSVGYVSTAYLTGLTVYRASSIPVPYFKQTDSRWSWATLGSSGKTIGRVGCATTSIAMMESYRTGVSTTPLAMSKKLSYTSSGNVYWPSHYTLVTRYSLDTVYRLLSEGKPVLFGVKNASGGQHWVVVTGCRATDTLTPADFYIHDPAVKSRTTLAHLFEAYPYFYKLFYY